MSGQRDRRPHPGHPPPRAHTETYGAADLDGRIACSPIPGAGVSASERGSGPESAVAKAKVSRVPAGLRARGRRFWREILAEFELSTSELALFEAVCRTLDVVDSLHAAVRADGVTVAGAAGQTRSHPALVELRQQQVVLGRLLSQLSLPDETGETLPSLTETRARRAADARWRPHRAKAAGRG